MARPRELPSRARVVIIGGGVGGTSIAYHLAQLGERDVVLVDRNELTSGSTFHSAGLVGQLRSSVSLTKMMMYSVELYRRLAAESEFDPGWVECGGIRLACTPEREQEIHRQVAWAKTFGLPLELISPQEAQERFPLMVTDGVRVASFLPTDGYLDPSQLTYALADGARRGGVQIFTHTRVDGHRRRGRRGHAACAPSGATSSARSSSTPAACSPPRSAARRRARPDHPVRARVPRQPAVRGDAGGARTTPPLRHLPTLRDPDLLVYYREEGGGLVMGGYERDSAPWSLDEQLVDRIPPTFNGQLLEEDWDRFEEITENSRRRVPSMNDLDRHEAHQRARGVHARQRVLPRRDGGPRASSSRPGSARTGSRARAASARSWPSGSTPASRSSTSGTWTCAGSGPRTARRRTRSSASRRSTRPTTTSATPATSGSPAVRCGRRAPTRGTPAHGAAFGEKSGWERVNWYEPNARGRRPRTLRPRGWAGKHWSPAIGAEHRAARETAALFDESSFAKLQISGPGAAEFLERLCDNRVARGVGQITYTQMLNSRGGIECDFTVTRLAEDRFSIVTGTAFGQHDAAWLRQHAPRDGSVEIHDMTARWACFALWGPRARDILQPLTPDSLSNADFPYMTMREITVGDVPVRALRVTFVGELGWELYCPTEYGAGLWNALWEAGQAHGIVAGGYKAIDTLRLEKGYRVWAADITPDETPVRGGARLLREARQGRRLHRARARSRPVRRRATMRSAWSASRSPTRARSRWGTSPCGSAARSPGA